MTTRRLLLGALWALVIATWVALARLAMAFVSSDLTWRTVAEHSRRDAPFVYRMAGVWGGMEGSLLLFVGIVGVVALVGVRGLGTRGIGAAATTVGSLMAIDLVLASPFERLDVPAVQGFGLTPILEHPAMAVHPPLLYLGVALCLPPFLAALDGRRLDPRRWLAWSVALTTVAMALGAMWSYVEQGWGGYWAWDPVENTSLLVWLAALIVLHLTRPSSRAAAMPWLVVLASAALVRSGSTPSIHGFAEQADVGVALTALLAASAVAVFVLTSGEGTVPLTRLRLVATVALAATTVVVVLGTLAPVLADVVGDRPAAVRGEFYARTVGLLVLVAAPSLVWRTVRIRGRSTLAHIGALVLLVGIAATTFDRDETVPLAAGQTMTVAGLSVRNDGVEVTEGPRAGTDRVLVRLAVDGRAMVPSIVTYPERGGRLAETVTDPGVWRDVQVALVRADDTGAAVVTVRSRPLVWLVWFGSALTAIGVGLAHSPRRWRLRASSSSIVDPPAWGVAGDDGGEADGGDAGRAAAGGAAGFAGPDED